MSIGQWKSPNGEHHAKWRWGGEMWMSGPEWGYLSVDGSHEFKGAAEEVIWSEDSRYLAFVVLHIEDVPNRKGAEGINFRVGILRIADWQLRYCLGNLKLSEIKLESFTGGLVTALVNGNSKQIQVDKVQW
jgi:hypothetical protein